MKSASGFRWTIVALLFFATTINYLDRQIIGLLKPILEKEFAWTETDYGRIVAAFTAAYALGLLSFGRLIDKVGTKMGYTISVTVWSVMSMAHAAASGVMGFTIARVGLGLGEAGNYPAAVKAVSEWFPKKERALATGLFNAGTSLGVVFALFITPFILSKYGWQEVFLITGALGFVWLIFWLWLYEIPERSKRVSKHELAYINQGQDSDDNALHDQTKSIKWGKLFTLPQTWAYVFGKFLIDPIYWFFSILVTLLLCFHI